MLRALKTTLRLSPDHQEAYKQMLWAVEYAGAYEDSIGFHNALLDKNPFNALAWMNMGYAYTALEKHDSALEAFGFAYAIDEEHYDAYMETGEILIHQKHFNRAIIVYKQAFALCGISATGLHKLGYCFEKLHQYKTACQYYLQAIELNAKDALSFYRMGVCALNEKQFRLAIQFINSAIEIDDSDENFFLDLARAYKKDNQPSDALRAYRFATDLAPDIENSWVELIQFLLEANQVRTAERVVQEALLNITTPHLEIFNLGIHYTLKRKKKALKLLKQFVNQTKETKPSLLFTYFPALANEKDIIDVMRNDL